MAEKKSAKVRENMDDYVPSEAREHMKAAREAMHESVRALFPPEFIEQRRAARREMLLAARSMIDHAIERIDRKA
jgi:hypothetical protein